MASSVTFDELLKRQQRGWAESPAPLPVKGGRQSIPDVPLGLSSQLFDLGTVQPDFNPKFLEALEHLAKFHGDVSLALDNIVQLGNTGGGFPTGVYFDDGVSDELGKEMITRLKEKSRDWYAFSGGINSLTNDLLAQAAINGAISAECVPSESLDGIKKCVLVSPKNIRFKYDREKDVYIPMQVIPNNSMQSIGKYGMIELNTITYFYSAIRRIGEKPYAIPPFISALESIGIGRSMTGNFGYIMKKLGMLGFLEVVVNAPAKQQGENDEQYFGRTGKYLDMVIPEIDKGMEKGFVTGFKNLQEFKLHSTAASVHGAKELVEINDTQTMAGLKQDPLMFGRNFSTTETLGRVILAKMTTQVGNYQQLVSSFYEKLFLMDLQLAGYPVKSVEVEYDSPNVGDKLRDAQTRKQEIENSTSLYNAGIISQQQRAVELGYEKPDQEEPRQLFNPLVAAPDANGDNNKGTDPNEENDATDEKTTGANTKDMPNLIELSFVKNFGHLPEYPYESEGCNCGHHDHVGSFAKAGFDEMQKYIDAYYSGSRGNYTKAVNKMVGNIGAKLMSMQAASQQDVIDAVIYTLYKDWGTVFTAPQKKIVTKFVKDIYMYFRKDVTAAFGQGAEVGGAIPKGALSTLDVRAMEYYQKSDSLYLGKFITDKDLKIKITNYLKDNYLSDDLPLANDVKSLAKFKEEFAGLLDLQDWKIARIINTSVSKMRNTASVSYMDQAAVEQFEIVGVNDRLQCAYCAALQGKTFSVKKAVSGASSMFNSDPELVGVDAPFLTSLVKDPDTLLNMTGADIQGLGFVNVPCHSNCRDTIVAVL